MVYWYATLNCMIDLFYWYKHKGAWRRASLCSDRSDWQRIESNPSCTKVVFNCELQEIPAIELFDIPWIKTRWIDEKKRSNIALFFSSRNSKLARVHWKIHKFFHYVCPCSLFLSPLVKKDFAWRTKSDHVNELSKALSCQGTQGVNFAAE